MMTRYVKFVVTLTFKDRLRVIVEMLRTGFVSDCHHSVTV